jgi:hypothetical protein
MFDNDSAFEMTLNSFGDIELGLVEPQTLTTFTDAAIVGHYMKGELRPSNPGDNGQIGEYDFDSSGGLTIALTNAGENYFSWAVPLNWSYQWASSTYGSLFFGLGGDGRSCIVISSASMACVMNTGSAINVGIYQK